MPKRSSTGGGKSTGGGYELSSVYFSVFLSVNASVYLAIDNDDKRSRRQSKTQQDNTKNIYLIDFFGSVLLVYFVLIYNSTMLLL